jgi:hypothetical protein
MISKTYDHKIKLFNRTNFHQILDSATRESER